MMPLKDPGSMEIGNRSITRLLGKYWHVALLGLFVFAVAWVRWRLAGVPFERDEGEYAYAGQLILQGIPPYQLAYNMKFPGTYYAYALIMAIFGETVRGVHFGLLLISFANTILVYLLGRRFLGPFPAATGAAAFAVLALDRWIMGVFAHATHFALLPALFGLLLLCKYEDTRRSSTLITAGVLLGLALLMKQHAIFFLLFAGGMLLYREWKSRPGDIRNAMSRSAELAAGALIPFGIVVVVLFTQGVLGKFWFWCFKYAAEYVSQTPLTEAWQSFKGGLAVVTRANSALWLASIPGYLFLWINRRPTETKMWFTAFALASLASLVPGFFFRPHYFILLLPAAGFGIALLMAALEAEIRRFFGITTARLAATMLFLVPVGIYAYQEQYYLTSMTPRELSRTRYGSNPFIEAVEIADYLKQHTTAEDRIAVLGSEPEVYFYANRKSATGYIYTYPLMEPQAYARKMQEEMISEIETVRPKYMVLFDFRGSWKYREDSVKTILGWMVRYRNTCYTTVGAGEPLTMEKTVMLWGREALNYKASTDQPFYVLKRNHPGPCNL